MDKDIKVTIGLAIGIILAVVLMQSAANNVNASTVTQLDVNRTVTCPANGTAVTLSGKNYVGTAIVSNSSNYDISTNFTLIQFTEGGQQKVGLNNSGGASSYVGRQINVTYTYQPYGYISSSGGRSLTDLVIVISAIALVIFTVSTIWRKNSMRRVIRR